MAYFQGRTVSFLEGTVCFSLKSIESWRIWWPMPWRGFDRFILYSDDGMEAFMGGVCHVLFCLKLYLMNGSCSHKKFNGLTWLYHLQSTSVGPLSYRCRVCSRCQQLVPLDTSCFCWSTFGVPRKTRQIIHVRVHFMKPWIQVCIDVATCR